MTSRKEVVNICDKRFQICSEESFTSFGKIPCMSLAFLVHVFNNSCTSTGVVSLKKKLRVLGSF